MAISYIVRTSAILGFPLTDRTFLQGESVTEEDFARCPDRFDTFVKRGSLKKATEEEAAAGEALRERNDALHLGLDSSVPRPEVLKLLQERREALDPTPKEKKDAPQGTAAAPAAGTAPMHTAADLSTPPVAVVTPDAAPAMPDADAKTVKKRGD